MWAGRELWCAPVGLLICLTGGPAPCKTPWRPPALQLRFSHGTHTRSALHIEIVTVWSSSLPWGLCRCSFASSFEVSGRGSYPAVFPSHKGQDWFPRAAPLPGGLSSAELPISNFQWNSKQTSWIQNQPLLVLVSTRYLHTWWGLRYLSFCPAVALSPSHSAVWAQAPVGFAVLQSPISKPNHLFFSHRQLAVPWVGSIAEQ